LLKKVIKINKAIKFFKIKWFKSNKTCRFSDSRLKDGVVGEAKDLTNLNFNYKAS